MNSKTILKTLAMAMLMPAMLLTTACSSEDDLVNNTANTENTINKGYALPVTVNVTRQGDATTRATYTYNEGTKKGTLSFSDGDKLFVSGYYEGDKKYEFAGELTWQSGEIFSGTIYTSNGYSGAADELFSDATGNGYVNATLLPAGYGSYGFLTIDDYNTEEKYDDDIDDNKTYTLATSKAAGVEQFSCEEAAEYVNGFELAPKNAILNFTITGLAASTNVAVSLTGGGYTITKTVTTDSDGKAVFAAGVEGDTDLNSLTLTVAGNAITLVSSSKELEAGKIYNISRSAASAPTGVLNGVFSVSSTKQVKFSKGNLQAKIASYASHSATASEWKFADSQDSYIGNAAGNTSFATGTWVDLFCWVGNSATNDTYGLITFTSRSQANHGNVADESLKTDWGTAAASSIGEGWRTLTSAEWTYLFNTRTVNNGTGSGKSYTWGKYVNGVLGVVLYPDDYTGAEYSGSHWSDFESAGCVFLPAAGRRNGTTVYTAGTYGGYWSSTANTANGTGIAYRVYFFDNSVDPALNFERDYGLSVRLVRDVE